MKTVENVKALIAWCEKMEGRFNTAAKVEAAIEDGTLGLCYRQWGTEITFVAWGNTWMRKGEWTWCITVDEACGEEEFKVWTTNTEMVKAIAGAVGWSGSNALPEDGALCSTRVFGTEQLRGIKRPKSDYHTYLIGAIGTDLVKIGKTKNVDKRLRELQTASPHKLQVLVRFESDIERHLHQHFKEMRVNGEWFTRNEELNEFISATGFE